MSARSTLTVTSGSTITSSWGNAVRNHVVSSTRSDVVSTTGQTAVITSTGRLVYWNGSAAVPIAGDMPRAKGSPSAATSIGSATVVALQWNTEEYDTASMFTAFGTTITAAFTGIYLVTYRVSFASAANGVRQTFIRRNDGVRYGDQTESVTATATGITLSGSAEVDLAASQYVECCAYQDTGAGLNVQTSTADYFAVRFLGPTV